MIGRSAALLCCLIAPVLTGAIGAGHAAHDHGTHDHGTHDHDTHDHDTHDRGAQDVGGQPRGHEHDEGLVLRPNDDDAIAGDGTCPPGAPERRFDIVALAVDITLNRYGDHDPEGRMYAHAEDVDEVRAAEQRRMDAVSLGLQGDVLQPLVLRVLPGECVRVRLTNELPDEPASFHIHGSSLVVSANRSSATAENEAAMAEPGGSVEYEWMVSPAEPEGTHLFHSHGDPRAHSGHGLFGALVVEPAGSDWTDPRTGEPATGWDAVVTDADGVSFREFVLMYHEIGDENYLLLDAEDKPLPLVDPTTNAYRPGARALNYRSEPFMNRIRLGALRTGRVDESVAYSSYAFGDPATPIQRSYMGDPVKERVLHAGSEVAHVHHVHGGSVRWRRQPGAGAPWSAAGLDEPPPLLPGPSERTDSQTIGPSETFDVEHECAAGGCQQGAGDYLVHCHVAHHYFAGMWGIWRVYNTLQDGAASTDSLPPLPPLPDRAGDMVPAVPSDELDAEALERATDSLPPAGVPKGYDASVFDWTEEDGRIVGEPETFDEWPGYVSPTPGVRPPILFEPDTGRPAYPMLRPHLGARPPFAPGNGPAAYIDRPRPDGLPSPPGADGADSLCPPGTTTREFSIRALALAVPVNERLRILDPNGVVFALAEDVDEVVADPLRRTPLAVRANAGEHCVDITVTNGITDNADHPFSKISAHIHFMQFDVQSGDGVDTGFNFEQTVRPFEIEGERMRTGADAGATRVDLEDAARFSVGAFVGVGMQDAAGFEIRRIVAIEGASIELDRPLERVHPAGGIVSTEFLRQRWYPDVQVGTAYFHDHVNGIKTWQHGLVGAIVVEPPGATYHDPVTGEEVTSGAVVDVRVADGVPVSADIDGSFREFVAFLNDPSRLTNVDRSPGANINLRAEPTDRREGPADLAFSSDEHGDPATPIVRAYVGDPIVVRSTVSGTNEIHTLHVDGHWFRDEPWSTGARPVSTTHVGISERKDLSIPAAGGPQQRAGDYMYANGRALKLREGAWGLLRVLPGPVEPDLRPLPGNEPTADSPPPVCPADAPVRRYDVAAIAARLPMLGSSAGRIFVEASQVDAFESGDATPTPLVLRAAIGDCIEVTLENRLADGSPPVSLHADGLAFDPLESGGIAAGTNPVQSVAAGTTRTYTFFAHPEYGPGAAMLRDGADLANGGARGAYGAVVVAPTGAEFDDPIAWSTTVRLPDGTAWRDAVLFMHDSDDAIGSHRMPYTVAVRGATGINYGFDDSGPVIDAFAGDPLQLHVLAPWSEQVQVFSVEGHRWPVEPGMDGSTRVSSISIGGLESITVIPDGGAGGDARLPGTYEFGNHREPYREAGAFGRLVVHDRSAHVDGLEPLLQPDPAAPPDDTMPLATIDPASGPPAAEEPPADTSTNRTPYLVGGVLVLAAALAAAATLARRREEHRRDQG